MSLRFAIQSPTGWGAEPPPTLPFRAGVVPYSHTPRSSFSVYSRYFKEPGVCGGSLLPWEIKALWHNSVAPKPCLQPAWAQMIVLRSHTGERWKQVSTEANPSSKGKYEVGASPTGSLGVLVYTQRAGISPLSWLLSLIPSNCGNQRMATTFDIYLQVHSTTAFLFSLTGYQLNVLTYNVFKFLSLLNAPGWISLILLNRRSLQRDRKCILMVGNAQLLSFKQMTSRWKDV